MRFTLHHCILSAENSAWQVLSKCVLGDLHGGGLAGGVRKPAVGNRATWVRAKLGFWETVVSMLLGILRTRKELDAPFRSVCLQRIVLLPH